MSGSDPFAFANPCSGRRCPPIPSSTSSNSLLRPPPPQPPLPSSPPSSQPFLPPPSASSDETDPFAGLSSFSSAPSTAASAPPPWPRCPLCPPHVGPVLSLHPLTATDDSSHSALSSPLSPQSPNSDQALLQQILNEEKTDANGAPSGSWAPPSQSARPSPFSSSPHSTPDAASFATSGPPPKRKGKVIVPLSPGEVASISDPLKRAEAAEAQKSLIGNFRIIAPLKAKREQLKLQPVQNILRLQPLQGIKAEVDRAKSQLGDPTCSAIGQRYIAVGFTRGVTLVFNHFEQLQMALGRAVEDGKNRGAVTCLDFSPTGEQLLCGHQRGVCVVWDLSTKKEVKDIKDASTRPITHVRFTKRGRPVFIAVDDMGIVTLFTLSKVSILVNVNRQVLLQGKAGRVLAIAVLMANPDFPHLSDNFGLIAIATESMMTVIAMQPELRIAYRLPREEEARPGVLPSLCWRALQARDEAVGKSSETSEREVLLVRHPVLVTARGSIISYVQVSPFERHEIAEQRPDVPLKFNHVGMIGVQGEVAAIEWLGGRC